MIPMVYTSDGGKMVVVPSNLRGAKVWFIDRPRSVAEDRFDIW